MPEAVSSISIPMSAGQLSVKLDLRGLDVAINNLDALTVMLGSFLYWEGAKIHQDTAMGIRNLLDTSVDALKWQREELVEGKRTKVEFSDRQKKSRISAQEASK